MKREVASYEVSQFFPLQILSLAKMFLKIYSSFRISAKLEYASDRAIATKNAAERKYSIIGPIGANFGFWKLHSKLEAEVLRMTIVHLLTTPTGKSLLWLS